MESVFSYEVELVTVWAWENPLDAVKPHTIGGVKDSSDNIKRHRASDFYSVMQ